MSDVNGKTQIKGILTKEILALQTSMHYCSVKVENGAVSFIHMYISLQVEDQRREPKSGVLGP